jgi:hypothetical protein
VADCCGNTHDPLDSIKRTGNFLSNSHLLKNTAAGCVCTAQGMGEYVR